VRFGVVFGFRRGPLSDRFDALYRDALRIGAAADELGFDSLWISEHHGIADGYCPAPFAAAAAMIARTDRITVGTKLIVAPLHHPLDVAENGAFLDQLSSGRFELGLGAGYRREEFAAREIPFAERGDRLEETIEIVRRAWTTGSASFTGTHLTVDQAVVAPPPLQRPHPRIWVGATTGRAIERAARLDCPLMIGNDMRGYYEYLDAVEAHGRGRSTAEIMHSFAAVHLDTDGDAARRIAWPGVAWLQWRPVGAAPPWSDPRSPGPTPTSARCGQAAFVGSPAEVAEAMLEVDAVTPLQHVTFHPQIPGVPLEATLTSLRLFAREVAPILEAVGRARTAP
jgi:alkanesulfonate monooxygenase SsuD/methylene tetrahydromethanopterin reductase-like flavin-dependent oxidoreductase (luciferase family)